MQLRYKSSHACGVNRCAWCVVAAVMAAAAGSGLDQSPSHRKRTRAQRSFTAEDAQVGGLPVTCASDARGTEHSKVAVGCGAVGAGILQLTVCDCSSRSCQIMIIVPVWWPPVERDPSRTPLDAHMGLRCRVCQRRLEHTRRRAGTVAPMRAWSRWTLAGNWRTPSRRRRL